MSINIGLQIQGIRSKGDQYSTLLAEALDQITHSLADAEEQLKTLSSAVAPVSPTVGNSLSVDIPNTYTVTNTQADVTGLFLTLTQTGTYIIIADLGISTDVASQGVQGFLLIGGASQTGIITARLSTGNNGDILIGSFSRAWQFQNMGTNIAKLQAIKGANAGTSQILDSGESAMKAIFLG